MSLMSEIKTYNEPRTIGCTIESILAEFGDQEDIDDLNAALLDASITHTAIARALAGRGYTINKNGKQVARHRKGECQCHR